MVSYLSTYTCQQMGVSWGHRGHGHVVWCYSISTSTRFRILFSRKCRLRKSVGGGLSETPPCSALTSDSLLILRVPVCVI